MTSRSVEPSAEAPIHNADVEWDRFDPGWYFEHNYSVLRVDDRQVIERIRDHFCEHAASLPADAKGIDVGPGANLYPALAMLPFCHSIELHEVSHANIRWLSREIHRAAERWSAFWNVYCERPAYACVTNPWFDTARKVRVKRANALKAKPRAWHIGTMMFVAESLSGDVAEFRQAVQRFVGSLLPGAPFAMAFMAESIGYQVGDIWYPAVPVDDDDIVSALGDLAAALEIVKVPIPEEGPLHEGYDGMLLALGRAA